MVFPTPGPDSADEAAWDALLGDEAALAAGGTTIYAPSQREWGAFAAQVADPDGHLWMILVSPSDWTR